MNVSHIQIHDQTTKWNFNKTLPKNVTLQWEMRPDPRVHVSPTASMERICGTSEIELQDSMITPVSTHNTRWHKKTPDDWSVRLKLEVPPNSSLSRHQMPTRCRNSFAARQSRKFVIRTSLKNNPPHLKRVATLPCEVCGTFMTHSGQPPDVQRHSVGHFW